MRFSTVHVASLGRASVGKYPPIPHLAANGSMDYVLCRNEYCRQSTFLSGSPHSVDYPVRRITIQYDLAKYILIEKKKFAYVRYL